MGARAGVAHLSRPRFRRPHPIHLTFRLVAGLPTLRTLAARDAIEQAFRAGRDRFGMRLVHYSIQSNHMHLLVEARDTASLCRGAKGMVGRLAKALNRAWRRGGAVFENRYHAHVLRTPREVRNALRYVLGNSAKHGVRFLGPDPFTSLRWKDGDAASLLLPPTTWLLSVGWRRGSAEAGKDTRSRGPSGPLST